MQMGEAEARPGHLEWPCVWLGALMEGRHSLMEQTHAHAIDTPCAPKGSFHHCMTAWSAGLFSPSHALACTPLNTMGRKGLKADSK